MSLIDRIVSAPLGDDPPKARLLYGQAVLQSLRLLPAASIHTVCTSPPYWGLRDYQIELDVWGGDENCVHEWGDKQPHGRRGNRGVSGTGGNLHPTLDRAGVDPGSGGGGQFCQQCEAWCGALGLEPTPEMFVEHLVEVFNEVRRVLRPDGTLWVNLGDSYANDGNVVGRDRRFTGLKLKDLVGIPWMVAFALRGAGWYLRSDIIWAKSNPMPESVQDRPTKAHEYVFLFAHPDSGGRYFYDTDAIREPIQNNGRKQRADLRLKTGWKEAHFGNPPQGLADSQDNPLGRNRRTVWNVNPKSYLGAHFAVWPEALVEPMIKAGSSEQGCCSICLTPWTRLVCRNDDQKDTGAAIGGDPARHDGGMRVRDVSGAGGNLLAVRRVPTNEWQPGCDCNAPTTRCTVLDPFSGSATTGAVAMRLGRNYIGIDLQPNYLDLAMARLEGRRAPVRGDVEAEEEDIFDVLNRLGEHLFTED